MPKWFFGIYLFYIELILELNLLGKIDIWKKNDIWIKTNSNLIQSYKAS